MQANHIIAGKALKLMFIGALVALIATALGMIPVISAVSGIVALVGGVISLIGLIQAGPAHKLYGRAILMLILSVVLSLVSGGLMVAAILAGSGAMMALAIVVLLGISIFGLLQIYFICSATSTLLREAGNETSAAKGDTVWKINAVCYIATGVLSVVSLVAPTTAGILGIITGIVSIVGSVIYVIFLKEGTETLSASGAAQA